MKSTWAGVVWTSVAASILLLLAATLGVPLPFESLLLPLRGYDTNLHDLEPLFQIRDWRRATWLLTGTVSSATTLALVAAFSYARWSAYRDRLFRWCIAFASAVTLLLLESRAGFEAPWYPLQRVMADSASLPVFGHRLLLVWPARLLQLTTHVGARPAFFAVQAVVVATTVCMIIRWSALFVGPTLAWLGGPLLVLFLSPTILYLTFFDCGIVFFHCLGLWALRRRFWFVFFLAIGVGALNHENIAILIPTAAAVCWGIETRRVIAAVLGTASVAFLTARSVMQIAAPHTAGFELHLFTNGFLIEQMRRTTIESFVVLLFLFGSAALAWSDGDHFLRRAVLLVTAQLTLIALFAGRLNEARNFEAMIPLVIALVLSTVRRQAGLTPP